MSADNGNEIAISKLRKWGRIARLLCDKINKLEKENKKTKELEKKIIELHQENKETKELEKKIIELHQENIHLKYMPTGALDAYTSFVNASNAVNVNSARKRRQSV